MSRLAAISAIRLERQLLRELRRFTAAAAANYPQWGGSVTIHNQIVRAILTSHLPQTAVSSANLTRSLTAEPLAERLGVTRYLPTQKELDATVAKVARERAKQRAAEIADTSRTRVGNAVARGIEANESPAEISKRIRTEVDDMSRARAKTIARTEIAVAQQTGQYQEMEATAEALGLKLAKTWVATSDERTRESHDAADGQTVRMEDPFRVGEADLMFPSDPDGPAEEVINCRCAVVYDPL